MKKILSLITILFITINATAQIKEITSDTEKTTKKTVQISKISLLGNLIGQLNKEADKDFYTVSYKDFKNTNQSDIKTFAIGNKETVKQYRDIMLAMILNKTNEKIIELEGNTISFKRKSNSIETLITNKNGETSKMKWIAKKHINILFPANKLN
jgi:predicted membrane protein